ncbi:hypothetical protein BT93_F2395 [Corymbia citriodora subsp. variegata]|nr:hypothetical protein BT93_F2395 [Corymbia citriodora subsp. variegata]
MHNSSNKAKQSPLVHESLLGAKWEQHSSAANSEAVLTVQNHKSAIPTDLHSPSMGTTYSDDSLQQVT